MLEVILLVFIQGSVKLKIIDDDGFQVTIRKYKKRYIVNDNNHKKYSYTYIRSYILNNQNNKVFLVYENKDFAVKSFEHSISLIVNIMNESIDYTKKVVDEILSYRDTFDKQVKQMIVNSLLVWTYCPKNINHYNTLSEIISSPSEILLLFIHNNVTLKAVNADDTIYVKKVSDDMYSLPDEKTYIETREYMIEMNPTELFLCYDSEEVKISSIFNVKNTIKSYFRRDEKYAIDVSNEIFKYRDESDKRMKQMIVYYFSTFVYSSVRDYFKTKITPETLYLMNESNVRTSIFSKYTSRSLVKTKLGDTQLGDTQLEHIIGKMNMKECDHNLFQKLWGGYETKDQEYYVKEYGPIVASCCYMGCFETGMSMYQFMNRWTMIKKQIEKFSDLNFMVIYQQITKPHEFNHEYCPENYNFLLEFYEKGYCNCECGTYLCMAINNLLPMREASVFVGVSEEHMNIIVYQNKKLYQVETTNFSYLNDNVDEMFYIIVSEQILALNMIFNSFYFRSISNVHYYDFFGNLFLIMFGESCDNMDLVGDILKRIKRHTITNYLDIVSFNTFVSCFIIAQNLRSPKKCNPIFLQLQSTAKKYLRADLDDYLNNTIPTQDQVQERINSHSDEIQSVINSFKSSKDA